MESRGAISRHVRVSRGQKFRAANPQPQRRRDIKGRPFFSRTEIPRGEPPTTTEVDLSGGREVVPHENPSRLASYSTPSVALDCRFPSGTSVPRQLQHSFPLPTARGIGCFRSPFDWQRHTRPMTKSTIRWPRDPWKEFPTQHPSLGFQMQFVRNYFICWDKRCVSASAATALGCVACGRWFPQG